MLTLPLMVVPPSVQLLYVQPVVALRSRSSRGRRAGDRALLESRVARAGVEHRRFQAGRVGVERETPRRWSSNSLPCRCCRPSPSPLAAGWWLPPWPRPGSCPTTSRHGNNEKQSEHFSHGHPPVGPKIMDAKLLPKRRQVNILSGAGCGSAACGSTATAPSSLAPKAPAGCTVVSCGRR